MNPLDFDPSAHTYARAGVKVFGVTEALGLVYPQFDGVALAVLEAKRNLGIAIHAACDLDDLGTLDDATVHPLVRPGLEAWRTFKREIGYTPRFSETLVYSTRYDFGGRTDGIGLIAGQKALDVIDRKVVRKISQVTVLQTAAYRQAALETFHGERIGRRIVVQLPIEAGGRAKVDGPYERHDVHLAQFLNTLGAARFGVAAGLYKAAA